MMPNCNILIFMNNIEEGREEKRTLGVKLPFREADNPFFVPAYTRAGGMRSRCSRFSQ